MDEDHVRKGRAEPRDGRVAAVRRAVVRDPEDAIRCGIWRLRHHLRHQPVERNDPGRRLAAAEDCGPVHVERRQIGEGPPACVFVFDWRIGCPGPGGRGGVQSHPCLNTGLFIRAEDEIVRAQRLSFPAPGIEVEDVASLDGKLRIAGVFHVRCCHGRIASSCSHRQTVLSLTLATIPARWASRTTSAVLSRDSGTPSVAGSSHARAFTWTTTAGGKSSGDPSADARRDPADVHRKTACATD